ncbi:MAG: NAD(P)/FAD-dependent oxidoreductase [Actinobacteria bacterium]|nr:NAD(P)/FAD-dependent oxidoreductase [Actinomycetota bacterium]
MARVLVLGGGFGGLAGAHELRTLLPDEHEVTVVARDDRFFAGFAKLWDLGDVRPLEQGTRSLTALSEHGIGFVQATVDRIEAAAGRVATSTGDLDADFLLVALGAVDDPDHRGALAGPAALNVYDADALPTIKRALDTLEGGRVIVGVLGAPFKCPPAPFEAAFVVEERLRRNGSRDRIEVHVAHPAPMTLPVAGAEASTFIAEALAERGIGLHLEHGYAALDGDVRTVAFSNGETMEFSLFLGVPRSVPPPVVADSDLAGEGGWIRPDRLTLRTEIDGVYAVGDCTFIPTAAGQPLPMAGVFARGEAISAARNIAAEIVGGEESHFDGHGSCYLELWDQRVAVVEGDFYADGGPVVGLSQPTTEAFTAKQRFEQQLLDAWLG